MNCKVCASTFTRLKDLIRHAISERLRSQPVHFICIPCSLPLLNIPDVIQHIESEEHSVMALATGIRFYTQSNSYPIDIKETFPPHNCCLLCSHRDLSPKNIHLKGPQHKYFVSLMKNVFRSKQIDCSEMPINFASKLIDMKENKFLGDAHGRKVFCDSSRAFCELCNINFNKIAHYMQHLEDESHKRVEQFIIKISNVVKEMDVVGAEYIRVSKTFSNSLVPLFYCELCCIWIDSTTNYNQHRNSVSHKRIEELFSKLSNKRNGITVSLRDVCSGKVSSFNCSLHYCKLCAVNFPDAMSYREHLNVIGHKRIEDFVDSLPSKSDKKFIGVYIDAQAHMKFNNTPPPNYCELCDILHSKYDKYEQHLQSDEHKQSEKYYLKVKNVNDDYFGEKSSKRLKTSPEPLHYCTFGKKYQRNKQITSRMLSRKKRDAYCGARAANASFFPRPGFGACETVSHLSSEFGTEANEGDSYSDILPDFEPCETIGHVPRQLGVEDRETNPKFCSGPDLEGNSYLPHQLGFVGYREIYNNFRSPFDEEIIGNLPPHGFEDTETNDDFTPHGFEDSEANVNFSPRGFEDSEVNDNSAFEEHYCELCDFRSYNPQHYEKHLMGDEHKKMRRMLNKKGKGICSDTNGSEISSNAHPLQYNCELCDVFNRNCQEYEFHLNTPKHKRNQWLLYVFKQKCL